MSSRIRELRRRLKRRLRNRQGVARYIQRLGLGNGFMAYARLVLHDSAMVRIAMPGSGGPVLVRPDTSDPFIFEEVFILDEYDFPVRGEPQVIFDIGANVGYTARYFAERYPQARIIAVEPDASNVTLLRENTADYPNITVVAAGIWSRPSHLALVNVGAKTSDFQFREAEAGAGTIEAVTVDDLLKLAEADHVDILKIDIEGGEKELFSENVEWLDKVGTLIIELHDRFRPGCKEAFLEAVSRYDFKGYEMGLNYIVSREPAR
jgi:FkbM family methyltransferase